MSLPVLMDDLIDGIILRFPPEEPELLVRASLVCKRWFRLISDLAFRRRFRELHRAPMLGILCTRFTAPAFVPTSSVPVPHAMRSNWHAVDSRHGRVVLHSLRPGDDLPMSAGDLLVWNPITDEQWALPKLPDQLFFRLPCSWTAAVLCAAADASTATAEAPSSLSSCALPPGRHSLAWVRLSPSVLVGSTLYFISGHDRRDRHIALVKMVDGRLGFAGVHESELYLWSREAGSEKYAGWAQCRTIDLETLLRPLGTPMDWLDVIYFVDGVAAFFMGTDGLVFAIDLKSGRITKIGDRLAHCHNIVPYMSFYTPATGEGPRAGAPRA